MTRTLNDLSRRERQIMEIVFAQGRVSAMDIQEALPDAPGYSTVRTLLRILEHKGLLLHEKQGMSFIYFPVQPTGQAAQSAIKQVIQTFFGSSIERLVTTLLSSSDARLTEEELDRLSALIERARNAEKPGESRDLKETEA